MNYFDLHCDTAYELYKQHLPLDKNTLALDLDTLSCYEHKVQVFAVWSENTAPADAVYKDFFAIFENLKRELEKNADRAVLCTDRKTLCNADTRLKVIPAVEGLRILENDPARLDALYECGVRIVTPAWEGESSVCGAYDTDVGFTDFGRRVIERSEELGMIIDVSHLSEKGFWELAGMAKKPFIASHSNARAVCEHPRNLTDTELRTIASRGGLVGVNLVGAHLSKTLAEENAESDAASVKEAISRHLVHIFEAVGTENVCFGCDRDGTAPLVGLERAGELSRFAEYMRSHGAPDTLIDNLFYNNAYRFFAENL